MHLFRSFFSTSNSEDHMLEQLVLLLCLDVEINEVARIQVVYIKYM